MLVSTYMVVLLRHSVLIVAYGCLQVMIVQRRGERGLWMILIRSAPQPPWQASGIKGDWPWQPTQLTLFKASNLVLCSTQNFWSGSQNQLPCYKPQSHLHIPDQMHMLRVYLTTCLQRLHFWRFTSAFYQCWNELDWHKNYSWTVYKAAPYDNKLPTGCEGITITPAHPWTNAHVKSIFDYISTEAPLW